MIRFSIVLSSPNTLEETAKGRHEKRALVLLRIKNSPENFSSLIQLSFILTTLTFGWVAAPVAFEATFTELSLRFSEYSEFNLKVISGFLCFSGLVAFQLLFSDIIPRIIVSIHPESLALKLYPILHILELILIPFIRLSKTVRSIVLKPLGISTASVSPSDDDLRVIVGEGMDEDRADLIENVFEFSGKNVHSVMVPRHKIAHLGLNRNLKENISTAKKSGYNRFPLVETDLDSVISYIHIKDLLWFANSLENGQAEKGSSNLKQIAREILYVPETKPISELLKEFQKKKAQLAIVIDEYGSVSGLITLEDIIEELVGEIQDEFDKEKPKFKSLTQNSYLVDGMSPIDDLEKEVGIPFNHDEDETMGGLILSKLGRIAKRGDTIEESKYRIKVLEVSKNRVIRVKLTLLENIEKEKRKSSKSSMSLSSIKSLIVWLLFNSK
jgi:CBS domain containing-hemolysin-like protein